MCSDNSLFMSKELKLLLVEDHPVYSDGLSLILSQMCQQLELESASSASEAKSLLLKRDDFDLILLDLGLPDGGGISVLKFLAEHRIFVPAVVLSASEEVIDVQRSIQAGASGFISKASSTQEIIAGLEQVLNGELCLPVFAANANLVLNPEEIPSLTPRQLDVLTLVCEGLPNKRICQRLNLTEHTVKTHMKTIFSALDVHNRTECAKVAIKLGLVER